MLKYFGYRFLQLIPKLLIITIVIFIGVQLIPGDPISRTVSPEVYGRLSEVQLDELRTNLGLNDPVYMQYFRWLGNIFQGNFGYSMITGSDIAQVIGQRLPNTMALTAMGFIIAIIVGLSLGLISALKRNTAIDYANTAFGMIGLSLPEFFLGLCAILIFSVYLNWLPVGGRVEYGSEGFFDTLKHLILPALCIAIINIATLMRFTRGSMMDVLNKDYIRTARSKGLSEAKVNTKHGFRNALIPIMVILIFRIQYLFSGAIIIENVFNYPGMGNLLYTAIQQTDMPVVMMCTLIISTVILLCSFLLDIVTAMLDPRIKIGATREG